MTTEQKLDNKQSIFEFVVTKLVEQEGPSMLGDTKDPATGIPINVQAGVCAYRSPNGRKCAVGVLIPDHMYKEKMEGKNAPFLLDYYRNLQTLPQFSENRFILFLAKMQNVHDAPENRVGNGIGAPWNSNVFEEFRFLAEKNNLSTDIITDLEAAFLKNL